MEEWVGLVKNDKKMKPFADANFDRSESLSIICIFYAMEECKALWKELNLMKEKGSQEEYF